MQTAMAPFAYHHGGVRVQHTFVRTQVVLPRDMVCTASSGLAASQTPCQRPLVSDGTEADAVISLPSHGNSRSEERRNKMTSMHELQMIPVRFTCQSNLNWCRQCKVQNFLDVCVDYDASAASPALHPNM
jgi:hypothetical protein